MIQDSHPVRAGIPDHYKALYKIDIVAAAATWTVNMDRLPSGFGGLTGSPLNTNAFAATGRGTLSFPQGLKVRGVKAHCDHKNIANGTQVLVFPANIDETAGSMAILTTLTTAPATLANPTNGDVIYVELDLESV